LLKLAGRGDFGETVPGEFNPFIPPAFGLAGQAVAMADEEALDTKQDEDEALDTPQDVDNNFYFFRTCPLGDHCSKISWSKAQCWGWTEDEAKQQLHRHLVLSGHHDMDSEAAWEHVEQAQVEVGDGTKYKKKQEVGGRSRKDRDAHAQAKVQAAPPGRGQKRPSSSTELSLAVRGSESGGIYISKEKLQLVIDSLARASTSAKHSQKLAAAAAEAFGAEATVLAETKAAFEAMKSLL